MTDSLRKVGLFEPDLRLGINGCAERHHAVWKTMTDFRFVCNYSTKAYCISLNSCDNLHASMDNFEEKDLPEALK